MSDLAVKTVNFALQGGGAHGAFTWACSTDPGGPAPRDRGHQRDQHGRDERRGVAYGLTIGGREGARQALTNFWRRVAHAASFSPLQPTMFDRLAHNHGLENSPAHLVFDILSRVLSPYQRNPFNYNPSRRAGAGSRLRGAAQGMAVKLFLSATNVRTGKVKVFTEQEITADCVLASACLPFLYQAVNVDGEYYWDGGYMGNPALFPLIYGCESRDIVVVHINPMQRPDVPHSARDIMNRINEISFNSSLMREMRAVAFVTKLLDDKKLDDREVKRMLIHAVSADDVMQNLGVASNLNAEWEFLTHLDAIGASAPKPGSQHISIRSMSPRRSTSATPIFQPGPP